MIYPGGRWQTSVPGLAALSTAYVLSGTDDVLAHVWDRGLRRTAIPPLRHPPPKFQHFAPGGSPRPSAVCARFVDCLSVGRLWGTMMQQLLELDLHLVCCTLPGKSSVPPDLSFLICEMGAGAMSTGDCLEDERSSFTKNS